MEFRGESKMPMAYQVNLLMFCMATLYYYIDSLDRMFTSKQGSLDGKVYHLPVIT